MKPRYIQENCAEENKIDPRQAKIVAKYRPDIILFELPAKRGNPSLIFNDYSLARKPLREIERIKRNLKIAARKYPYALSDICIWENIEKLWRDDRNVLLFNIDGPAELRREYLRISNGRSYDK